MMLSILCLTYQDAPVISSSDGEYSSSAGTRTRLFSAYIQRMFARRHGQRGYSQEQTITWLSWLANRMKQSSLSLLLIESIQPDWLPSTGWRRFYNLAVALIAGLPIGLLLGLGVAYPVWFSAFPALGWMSGTSLADQPVITAANQLGLGILLSTLLTVGFITIRFYGLLPALISGLSYGLSFGLPFERVFGRDTGLGLGSIAGLLVALLYFVIGSLVLRRSPARGDAVATADKLDWSWTRFAVGFLVGGVPGFIFGALLWWAIRGENFIPNFWTRFAITLGISAGANVGVLLGFIVQGVEQTVRPNQGIRRSAQNAISVALAIWLSVGLPLGFIASLSWRLAIGPANSLNAGVVVFMGIGLSLGLLTSLFFGSLACIQHAVLRLILAWRGLLPLSLISFLDSAAKRGFLQKAGGGFIFIHRLLMDHFADQREWE
jgi:hypothetical protein